MLIFPLARLGMMTASVHTALFVASRLHIVYRQVFEVPQFLHDEPTLDALSFRSDVMSSIKILHPPEAIDIAANTRDTHMHVVLQPEHHATPGHHSMNQKKLCVNHV